MGRFIPAQSAYTAIVMATSAATSGSGSLDQRGKTPGSRIRALGRFDIGCSTALRGRGAGRLPLGYGSAPRLPALLEPRVLKLPPKRIGARKDLEILLDSEHLHDRQIRANRYPCAASFDAAQCHRRHAGALGHLRSGQSSAQPRKAQPVAQLAEQLLRNRQQRGSLFGHNVNILAVRA